MTGGPLDAVAARLHTVPGMARWIGPDDGLVVAQGLALAGLAWPGRARWGLSGRSAALSVGAAVAGTTFALLAARPHGSRLTPRVAPPDDGELLQDGPYAVSRHPIYTGLLVATAGVAVLRRRPEPLAAWAALLVTLDAKTRAEEVALERRFGAAYARYRARTPRLVPLPHPWA